MYGSQLISWYLVNRWILHYSGSLIVANYHEKDVKSPQQEVDQDTTSTTNNINFFNQQVSNW